MEPQAVSKVTRLDFWGYPSQLQQPDALCIWKMGCYLRSGKYFFENYTDDGTGTSDGIANPYRWCGRFYINDPKVMDISLPYKYYNNQIDIFANKDARLFAHVITPGPFLKGVLINMQGGLITSTGTRQIFTFGQAVGLDGVIYYNYGSPAALGFSAFGSMGSGLNANSSSTGFDIKKFLQEKLTPTPKRWGGSHQDWISISFG